MCYARLVAALVLAMVGVVTVAVATIVLGVSVPFHVAVGAEVESEAVSDLDCFTVTASRDGFDRSATASVTLLERASSLCHSGCWVVSGGDSRADRLRVVRLWSDICRHLWHRQLRW